MCSFMYLLVYVFIRRPKAQACDFLKRESVNTCKGCESLSRAPFNRCEAAAEPLPSHRPPERSLTKGLRCT